MVLQTQSETPVRTAVVPQLAIGQMKSSIPDQSPLFHPELEYCRIYHYLLALFYML